MQRRHFITILLAGGGWLALPRSLLPAGNDPLRHVGIICDPIFLRHHIAPGHPESPQRYEAVSAAIQQAQITKRISMITVNRDLNNWLLSVHTQSHVEAIKGRYPTAFQVAATAARATLTGVDVIASQSMQHVFCASRPPGHHALNTGKEEGFCYFNHIAIAARYAQQRYHFKKILIIDWDYHHGNATEAMFYDDATVLFFSTHDRYAYPGTGDPSRTGRGKGQGFNINVHLPCGSGNKAIISAFEQRLVPAAARFRPDFVMISAGFDSRKDDLLGCFDVDEAGFQSLTRIARGIADRHCKGRLLSVLEGGYNPDGNARAVLAHLETLLEPG